MTAGRKPLPIETLKLRGSYRADRHGLAIDMPAGEVVRPDLPDGAAQMWDLLAPTLIECGLLRPVDVPLFSAFCREATRYDELCALVDSTGGPIVLVAGQPRPNPGLREAARCRDAMLAIGREFGLSPSARRALPQHAPQKAADPKGAARFFEGSRTP